MASKGFRQDMPPPGGYGPIQTAKGYVRTPLSGYTKFALGFGFTACMWVLWFFQDKKRRLMQVEWADSRIALTPLIKAERDRQFLLQLRKNRDAEGELMKDIPGWKVGTYYGEPVYYNVTDQFIRPAQTEYYAHANPRKLGKEHYAN